MKLEQIEISKINFTSWNPKSRTEKNMTGLEGSIDKHGLLQPVNVCKAKNGKFDLNDGNRRTQAHINLGKTHIWAIIHEDKDQAVVYAEANAHTKKHTSIQHLHIWLKNPNAVSDYTRDIFEDMMNVLGIRLVRRMAKENACTDYYRIARRTCKYIGSEESKAMISKVLIWLLDHRMLHTTRHHIEGGDQPNILYKAIMADKPLEKKTVLGRKRRAS